MSVSTKIVASPRNKGLSQREIIVTAALNVITEHGPKHYRELYDILVEQGHECGGNDPGYTCYAQIFTAIKSYDETRIVMVGDGVFATYEQSLQGVNTKRIAPHRNKNVKEIPITDVVNDLLSRFAEIDRESFDKLYAVMQGAKQGFDNEK